MIYKIFLNLIAYFMYVNICAIHSDMKHIYYIYILFNDIINWNWWNLRKIVSSSITTNITGNINSHLWLWNETMTCPSASCTRRIPLIAIYVAASDESWLDKNTLFSQYLLMNYENYENDWEI